MELSQGFPPVSAPDARVLILGSIPGTASLEAGEYYAFAHNAFWKIMGELFGASPELDYTTRLQKLTERHVALWDVIASCHRPGSLDASIATDGMITNDFKSFFTAHQHINCVCFNGQTAARLFRQKVQPLLQREFVYHTLPSTSPAHAARSYVAKLEAWSVIKT
jgi:hypoxanthine-DNA glycosylase